MDLNATPYAAVAYDAYYPSGGLDNIRGLFATPEGARQYLRTLDFYDNKEVHDLRELRQRAYVQDTEVK